MSLKDVFKENVKYYRKQLKLTQESLAKLSGLSTNGIGDTWTRSVGTKQFTSQYQ